MPARSVVFDTLSHPRRRRLLSVTQVLGHLRVHPEFGRRFEERSQPARRVPGDASFILQNCRDPVGRHPDRFASAFAVRPMWTLECGTVRAHGHSSAAALHRGILSGVVVNFLIQLRPPVYRLAGDLDCSRSNSISARLDLEKSK